MEPETNPEDPRQIYVKFAAPQLRDRNGKINAYYIKCTSVVSGEIISVVCQTLREQKVYKTVKCNQCRHHILRTI